MKDQEYDYFYDDEQDAQYCYPGTNILINKLDIRDLDTLHEAERDYSSVRQAELANKGVTGDFSFKHLCSIHRQLFQDIYTWAGKTRTVDISKGTIFCLIQFIEEQFEDLYRKLEKENFLADITDKKEMSNRLAFYLGELNMIHPFREGNGRTQRIYIEQLCQNNGRFEIDFTEATKEDMISASVRSANVSNDLLESLIYRCLVEVEKC
ncbi:MAG: Fic family protein [bacterium]|nr:Fic family protein [bacterium]MDY4099819.1 Fic family protein [Lachnospiraceae bacterium]